MNDLSGKVIFITGAAGNLGTAATEKFMQLNSKIALLDRSADRLQEMYADLLPSPDLYLCPSVDLTETGQLEAVVDQVLGVFGQIDVLANITGGYSGGDLVHETSLETLKYMYDLNVVTMFNVTQSVVPAMLGKGKGSIVNIGARAGLEGKSKSGAYSAAKSAVIRLTESMSAELKTKGIRVNCVLPGTIDTPSNRKAMPNADFSKWVPPELIAEIITFLGSEKSLAITGASIPAYGRG